MPSAPLSGRKRPFFNNHSSRGFWPCRSNGGRQNKGLSKGTPLRNAASTSKADNFHLKVAATVSTKKSPICGAVGASLLNSPRSWSRCPGTTILERACSSWPGCALFVRATRDLPGRMRSNGTSFTALSCTTSIASFSFHVFNCLRSALSNSAFSLASKRRGSSCRVPLAIGPIGLPNRQTSFATLPNPP